MRPHSPKPSWLKVKAPGGSEYARLKEMFRQKGLHTVCEEASCPNVAECWGGGTATLMLMGDTCTRACRFCNVKTGNPKGLLDELEPLKVAESIASMGLKYVVLTSVDRDDLPDGGADHFARTVEAIKKRQPSVLVEVLIPDFQGDEKAIGRVVNSGADVIAHNIETVKSLSSKIRDRRCNYDVSLGVLQTVKRLDSARYTKSSIMLGLGEKNDEVLQSMDDLREVGVDVLTIGQYLRPSGWHHQVTEYIEPEVFKQLEREALSRGFLFAASGPLVRSSYRAGEKFLEARIRAHAN